MKEIFSKTIIILMTVLLTAVLLTACPPPAKKKEVRKKQAVPVKVLEITTRDLPLVIHSVGRTAPNREVTLTAQVGGTIEGYRADVGDKVEKDQELVGLDPTDYGLSLSETMANLTAAKARLDVTAKSYKRIKSLLPRKVVTPDAYEKSEAEYKAAKAAVAQVEAMVKIARERLKKTKIHAPFSGLVAARMIEFGQSIAPGQPVMVISDLDTMRVNVHIPEKAYVNLNLDDPVSLTVDAFPGKEFKARIDRIGINADQMTSTFAVEVLVDNQDLLLKTGLTTRVSLTSSVLKNTIMIPQSAVLYKENRREVFIVGPDNVAVQREVKLGLAEGALIQVLEGLNPGDKLVISGEQYLKPGDSVLISDS